MFFVSKIQSHEEPSNHLYDILILHVQKKTSLYSIGSNSVENGKIAP